MTTILTMKKTINTTLIYYIALFFCSFIVFCIVSIVSIVDFNFFFEVYDGYNG
jgi:hypothetical protein